MSFNLLLKSFNRLNRLKTIHYISRQSISYFLAKLDTRKVISVKGNDSYDYIQGLND